MKHAGAKGTKEPTKLARRGEILSRRDLARHRDRVCRDAQRLHPREPVPESLIGVVWRIDERLANTEAVKPENEVHEVPSHSRVRGACDVSDIRSVHELNHSRWGLHYALFNARADGALPPAVMSALPMPFRRPVGPGQRAVHVARVHSVRTKGDARYALSP